MKLVKALLGAFIVGGAFGVAGQLLIMLFTEVLNMAFSTGIILVLVAMALIGSVLFISDIDPKIGKFGGCGYILTFSGFTSGTAGIITEILNSGAPLGKAIVGGLKPMLMFFVIAVVLSSTIGLFTVLIFM